MSKIFYAHIWVYAPNMIDFGHKLGKYKCFEWNQLYMKGKPKLHILSEYKLNNYLTVDSVLKLSQKMN